MNDVGLLNYAVDLQLFSFASRESSTVKRVSSFNSTRRAMIFKQPSAIRLILYLFDGKFRRKGQPDKSKGLPNAKVHEQGSQSESDHPDQRSLRLL